MACLVRDWGHLHYRFRGGDTGPVAVFLNSLGTDMRMWDGLIDHLPGIRALCLDARGHGLSATPAEDYGIEDLAADVVALMDHLEIDKAVAVGCSMGGLVAEALALDHAPRIAAAVLSNTAARIGSETSWQARIDQVNRDGLATMAPAIMARWFAPDFAGSAEVLPWATLLARSDATGYARACRALAQADLSARVDAIACPALVIAGSADQATPPELVEGLARAIPGARFHVIDGSGHLPAIDNPAATAALILELLGARP